MSWDLNRKRSQPHADKGEEHSRRNIYVQRARGWSVGGLHTNISMPGLSHSGLSGVRAEEVPHWLFYAFPQKWSIFLLKAWWLGEVTEPFQSARGLEHRGNHMVVELEVSVPARETHLPLPSSPCNSPGKNTGVGCHSLLQGVFLPQGSTPGFLRFRQILYHLSHQGSPLPPESITWKTFAQ